MDPAVLEECRLPPYKAFYSELKQCNILEQEMICWWIKYNVSLKHKIWKITCTCISRHHFALLRPVFKANMPTLQQVLCISRETTFEWLSKLHRSEKTGKNATSKLSKIFWFITISKTLIHLLRLSPKALLQK